MLNIQFSIRRSLLVACCWLLVSDVSAQLVKEKLQVAYQQFESDSQLRHAISSLYVINAKTGEVVFDKNSQIGLAGASTQKIITAATAFELLGKDYRYKTEFAIHDVDKNPKHSILYIIGDGDPTLGSWRYVTTKDQFIVKEIGDSLRAKGIKTFSGYLLIYEGKFTSNSIPGGWIWDDIGNYYGAGTKAFNWRENQFDMFLRSTEKIGDSVIIIKTVPGNLDFTYYSELKSAAKNTGDNAYIYYSLNGKFGIVRGTIPVGEREFVISGSLANPAQVFINYLTDSLVKQKFMDQSVKSRSGVYQNGNIYMDNFFKKSKLLFAHYSPTLDSIVYWFLKRSINLYGEALVKTFAYEKNKYGDTDNGIVIIKDFWKQKGLDPEEINIKDGSGLSPQNRITTHAQVEVLKYAKQQSWFPYFFDALPEFNNMKMKSGTIADAKGFCGYHTAADGNEYIFSFLINNYSGRSSTVVNKMYKVLDVLK